MTTAIKGTYFDAILGIYVEEPEYVKEFIVEKDDKAYAIFTTKAKAIKWIMKSGERGFTITEI